MPGAVLKVRQPSAVNGKIAVVALREANFIAGKKEDFAGQAAGPAGHGAVGGAVYIGELDLLYLRPDVGVKFVEPGVVEVAVDFAVFVVVGVGAVPALLLQAILQKEPGAVAGCVVKAGRLALVDHDEVPEGPVNLQFNDAANGLCAEFDRCHFVASCCSVIPTVGWYRAGVRWKRFRMGRPRSRPASLLAAWPLSLFGGPLPGRKMLSSAVG